jgi:AcrR family transcriptional regulator
MMAEPKWRRRSEARPDEILDAALDEFNERGFEATRVEDIAKRAGISKAGVYLYFNSKEEILRGLIQREIEPIARRIEAMAIAGVKDPLKTIHAIVAAFATVTTNPRFFAVPRVVISVAGRFPEIGEYYRKNVVEHGIRAIAALHRAGVKKGIFRDGDSETVARAIAGPMMMHAMWTHVLGGDPGAMSPAERAAAHIDLLLQGLATGKV